MSEIKILKNGGIGEIVEKKSRFIANLFPIQSKEEAAEYIAKMKKQYYDARHNCYAYTLGPNGEEFKSSDDGEPSGTAGRPMLEVLEGAEIRNTLVVVTRYFGGVLLGTGGLVRAYTEAVKEGLKNADIVVLLEGIAYEVVIEYTDLGKLQNYAKNHGVSIVKEEYGEKVTLGLQMPLEQKAVFLADITELFAGKITPTCLGEVQFEKAV